MKIHHVLANAAPEAGGPAQSVGGLAEELVRLGHQVTLHTLRVGNSDTAFTVQAYSSSRLFKRLRWSSEMRLGLRKAAGEADVFHVHSLWTMPALYPYRAALPFGLPIIASPRGTLQPYSLGLKRIRKKAMWMVAQRRYLDSAAAVHATSETEMEDIRSTGLRNPIAVIPNGISVPADSVPRPRGVPRIALTLGRLHPQKGLDMLVDAWATIQNRFPEWEVRIVGPDDFRGYRDHLMKRASRLGVVRLDVGDPVYGEEKARLFREVSLAILPSFTENFGMSIAEALANGIPAVATKGAPWRGLEERGCGWWVDLGVEPLAEAIAEAMSETAAELEARGEKGRAWIESGFSSAETAAKFEETYRWLINRAPQPDWVVLY